MAIDGKLIVVSYGPHDGQFDRDSLKAFLTKNRRALLSGKIVLYHPIAVVETQEEADTVVEMFRKGLSGERPAVTKPTTVAELLKGHKPKKR